MSFGLLAYTQLQIMKGSGAVGDSEKTVLTFDGDTNGKTTIETDEGILVKISDTAIAVENCVEITVVQETGFTGKFTKGELLTTTSDGLHVIAEQGGEIFVVSDPGGLMGSPGTYVRKYRGAASSVFGWTSEIKLETIHPIDPKFLPGVCLPVVELTTQPTAEGAPLTAEESANVQAALAMGVPCVVKFNIDGAEFGVVATVSGGVGMNFVLEGVTSVIAPGEDGGYLFTMFTEG